MKLSKYSRGVRKHLRNYEFLRTEYKSIVDVMEENGVKMPFGEFVEVCGRLAV